MAAKNPLSNINTSPEKKKPLSTEQKEIAILLTSYLPLLDLIDTPFADKPPFENLIVPIIASLLEDTYNIKHESALNKVISNTQSDHNYNMFIFQVYNLPIQILKTLQKFAPSNKELCGYWISFWGIYIPTLNQFDFDSPEDAKDFFNEATAKFADPSQIKTTAQAIGDLLMKPARAWVSPL